MKRPDRRDPYGFVPLMFRAHPWHGIAPEAEEEGAFTCYIELVPTDSVKYEVDKISGHLKVDRPQKYSSHCPTLYGFIPQTYCGQRIGERCSEMTGREGIRGDGDPIDICVMTERPIGAGDILVTAIPIGGIRMIDCGTADDKIIAVMQGDAAYGGWRDVKDAPSELIDRIVHYFLTYKQFPSGDEVAVDEVYGHEEALHVIDLSRQDYHAAFGDPEERLNRFLKVVWERAVESGEQPQS
ncbi:MAG: inorganic pyrophosphatase [Candidatus Xenobia bacterium]